MTNKTQIFISALRKYLNGISRLCVIALFIPFNIFSANLTYPAGANPPLPDTIPLSDTPLTLPAAVVESRISAVDDSVTLTPIDTIRIRNGRDMALFTDSTMFSKEKTEGKRIFTPDPTRAVWFSALCPGLGQIYNRRYWKLPIVAGAFLGLGYGASWNNGMLADYTRAYTDIMDDDPSTNSYMDFFPPNTLESSLNKSWLERTLKSRKDYYRRNRDLCIICMVGVYLIAMVDAYVDASLSNFDISPDLSIQASPAVISDSARRLPALGFQLALNF